MKMKEGEREELSFFLLLQNEGGKRRPMKEEKEEEESSWCPTLTGGGDDSLRAPWTSSRVTHCPDTILVLCQCSEPCNLMMSSIATGDGGGGRIQYILLFVHLFILLTRLSTHVHPLYLVWFQTLPCGRVGKRRGRKGLVNNSTLRPWEPNNIVPRSHVGKLNK